MSVCDLFYLSVTFWLCLVFSACLSICLSYFPSICLYVCLYVCLSDFLCLSVCLFLSLSLSLFLPNICVFVFVVLLASLRSLFPSPSFSSQLFIVSVFLPSLPSWALFLFIHSVDSFVFDTFILLYIYILELCVGLVFLFYLISIGDVSFYFVLFLSVMQVCSEDVCYCCAFL